MTKRNEVQQELEQIANANDGLLRPPDVVEFAKDETTALHSRFTWDDSKAGIQWRLAQARQVISYYRVEMAPAGKKNEITYVVHQWTSMEEDRIIGNGYRYTVDILSDDDRRAKLLQQAKKEFDVWKSKYQNLKELVPVFEAMDSVELAPVVELLEV